jgi:hypothetical protein
MPEKEDVLKTEICECGGKTVAEAIKLFQETDLPFKKAKKLVTECDKTCCRTALAKLFDMAFTGKFDYDEIDRLIKIRNDRLAEFIEKMKS